MSDSVIRYFPNFEKKPDMRESLFSRRNRKGTTWGAHSSFEPTDGHRSLHSEKLGKSVGIKIALKSISGTAVLKKNKILINGNETLESVLSFLKKVFNRNEHIYLYINNTIKPNLDDFLADLFDLYQVSNCLNISYSFTPAY
ncbi:hypothetical protein PCYB_124500 [Plasmodium cynomolgi strain B]|uniref:Ubiquitin-like protein ATG12 n=1 Tax=Plasmodium cynomolgi (strain B) TaxID=1120755 RepID=K6UW77_PLACD|nr:hypothetical protein PCYB_124500 [Plasmodium cynomolgi strain B]GAB67884.1 hypothetical protein PCYB_124500 [Plasmodium cynomolgi strain B]